MMAYQKFPPTPLSKHAAAEILQDMARVKHPSFVEEKEWRIIATDHPADLLGSRVGLKILVVAA